MSGLFRRICDLNVWRLYDACFLWAFHRYVPKAYK